MIIPFISIIVATFDRNEALNACVRAIRKLEYPHGRFEVIIVDDGSPVPVKTFGHQLQDHVEITVVRQMNAGPASARNMGAQRAKGDMLAFTDDDCTPTNQWLWELARTFNETPMGLIGGRTVNGLAGNLYSTASQIIVDEAYAYFLSRKSELRFFSSNNMAVSLKLFFESGGFDTSFRTSEDRDFCDRWIRQGHPLVYAPKAIVQHSHHLTLTAFCRQHFQYGRGAYQFHRMRTRRGSRILKPDLRFYASVCRRALLSPLSWKSVRMAGLMGLWQAANLAGFFWEAVHKNPSPPTLMCKDGLSPTKDPGWTLESREK